MTDDPRHGTRRSSGTAALIVGAALTITAVLSDAALVAQLVLYEPSCEPFVAWSFEGPCGVLRLLVVLMLPFLLAGVLLIAIGITQRVRRSRAA
jgi:hypothetical protein